MGWMQLAMLAAGLAQTNKETQEAEKAAMRKSTAQSGEWILPTAGANADVPVPNAWGNLMAGATSGSQMGQANKKSMQQDKYLDILSQQGSNRGTVGDKELDFSVPSGGGSYNSYNAAMGLY